MSTALGLRGVWGKPAARDLARPTPSLRGGFSAEAINSSKRTIVVGIDLDHANHTVLPVG